MENIEGGDVASNLEIQFSRCTFVFTRLPIPLNSTLNTAIDEDFRNTNNSSSKVGLPKIIKEQADAINKIFADNR